MQLLALADADLHLAEVGGHGRREVGHPERRNLRDVGLAALRLLERLDDEPDALVERDPEARHAHVGDGQLGRARLGEVVEERDDRSARSGDVAVADH